MTEPKLSPKQAKVLEFLLANVLLSVRIATSDIERHNFYAVYGEKGTGKSAIASKLSIQLQAAAVSVIRVNMTPGPDEQSVYSLLVNKEFPRVLRLTDRPPRNGGNGQFLYLDRSLMPF